jgi:hypothetical protein
MRKNRWRLGLCPRSHWGNLQPSPRPIAGLRGPLRGRGRSCAALGGGLIFLLPGAVYSASPPLTFVTSDACEILLVILKLVPLLLLSFNLNLTIAILYYWIFLLLKLSVCNLFQMLLPLLPPKLLNFFTFLLFLYLFTGRNFLEWQNAILEHLCALEAKRESGITVTDWY